MVRSKHEYRKYWVERSTLVAQLFADRAYVAGFAEDDTTAVIYDYPPDGSVLDSEHVEHRIKTRLFAR